MNDVTFYSSTANDTRDVFLCNSCGNRTNPELSSAGSQCAVYGCAGHIKAYGKEGAIIVNAIERAGYEVESCSFCSDADFKREIKIRFLHGFHSALYPVPKGFEVLDKTEGGLVVVRDVYKIYSPKTPYLEFAKIFAADKMILVNWAHKLCSHADSIRNHRI